MPQLSFLSYICYIYVVGLFFFSVAVLLDIELTSKQNDYIKIGCGKINYFFTNFWYFIFDKKDTSKLLKLIHKLFII